MEYTHAVIELPAVDTDIALDIGGSVAKVMHRLIDTKKDQDEGEETNSYRRSYNLQSFPRDKLGELFEYLQKHIESSSQAGFQRTINCTGLGGNEFKTKLEKTLNVRVENLNEFHCFIDGLNVILDVYGKGSFVTFPDSEMDNPISSLESGALSFICSSEAKDPSGSGLLPCLLVTCGSAAAFTIVNSDKSGHLVDGTVMAGRSFLGLAGLLSGVTDFSELMAMASEGVGCRVDTYAGDVKDSDVRGDFYSEIRDAIKMYAFGKATSTKKDEFLPEDLVRSLLEMICSNLVQLAYANAQILGVKNISFCGSFVESELVRQLIVDSSNRRNQRSATGHQMEMKFLRYGSYLGVIGAICHTAQSKQNRTTSLLEEHTKVRK